MNIRQILQAGTIVAILMTAVGSPGTTQPASSAAPPKAVSSDHSTTTGTDNTTEHGTTTGTDTTAAQTDYFGELGTIEIPASMVAAENKMKQIRDSKNISKNEKLALESKFVRLKSEFNQIWQPLEVNYRERVQLPGLHLKELHDLERLLSERDSKAVDSSNPEPYDKYSREESSVRLRIAEVCADYPERIKALNDIISKQKEALQTWSKSPGITEFLSQADRVLSRKQAQCSSPNRPKRIVK